MRFVFVFLVNRFRFGEIMCTHIYNDRFVCMWQSTCNITIRFLYACRTRISICMFVCCATRQIFDERSYWEKRERRNGVLLVINTQLKLNGNRNVFRYWLTLVDSRASHYFKTFPKFGKFWLFHVQLHAYEKDIIRVCDYDCILFKAS